MVKRLRQPLGRERFLRDQSHQAKPAETGVPISANQMMNESLSIQFLLVRRERTTLYAAIVSTKSSTVFRTGFISGNVESRNKVTSSPKLFSMSFCVRCCFSERS